MMVMLCYMILLYPSILFTFLPTTLTPHFRTDYLTIGALATKPTQLLIAQLTVTYPTH